MDLKKSWLDLSITARASSFIVMHHKHDSVTTLAEELLSSLSKRLPFETLPASLNEAFLVHLPG